MKQPLLPPSVSASDVIRDPESFQRATHALQRCAFMLRRKVGHEKEDPHFDRLVRLKVLHITVFSMMGVAAMIVMDVAPWYAGIKTVNVYQEANEVMKTVLISSQLILTMTSLITICLIMQYYHLLLTRKRVEWSGVDVTPKPSYKETPDEKHRRELDHYKHVHSYSLWASRIFKYKLFAEIIIHLVQPIIFLTDNLGLNEIFKLIVLCRLYVLSNLVHLYSAAYRNRFEIVNQCDEYKEANLKITPPLTFKSVLNQHTAASVAIWGALTVVIGGFGMFLVERDADSTDPWAASDIGWAGSMENSIYYAFIAASTIGYGDYYPATFKGRLVTLGIGIMGFMVLVVFQALLTNQLKPTKHEKYIRDYLALSETRTQYENKAATFIQRMWRFRRVHKMGIVIPTFHKSNVIFGAMKKFRDVKFRYKHSENFSGSSDVVLEEKLDDLMNMANDVGVGIQDQRDQLLRLHKKVHKNLKTIRAKIYERTGRK
eukprot:TRINITY_DN23418_c0_g1_i1.p1 TRINITY_DN23418_c0_g1~~TRINITY_DN23418_c0_g1_i1.p1  ORF type:complete len:487 (+),score=130.94 TRINITY_DN23418_c0_g1_i1:71-1531(+)